MLGIAILVLLDIDAEIGKNVKQNRDKLKAEPFDIQLIVVQGVPLEPLVYCIPVRVPEETTHLNVTQEDRGVQDDEVEHYNFVHEPPFRLPSP